jgi:SAM-dependent MidA family methyltransferase
VPNENVMKVLKPDRLFKDSNNEIKPGDRIEICPQAVKMIQEIGAIIEVSKGVSLIVDYGEDHAF